MAIFQSAGQALHVAYMMEVLPVRQKSFAIAMMEQAQREKGIFEPKARSTIDFEGLNDLEARGQCAMVRLTVEEHLNKDLQNVVKAMYAHQVKKAQAVRAVRDLCLHALTIKDDRATLAMTWRQFADFEMRKGLSVRKIADEYGLAKSTVFDDAMRIREKVANWEAEAVSHLDEIFVLTGVCAPI